MRYRFSLTMAAVPVSGAGSNHGAAAAAVARLMVVAAVGHAVMDVGTGGGAAVHGAQGQALTVAVAALMAAPAVGHAVMDEIGRAHV